ncbi:MAG: DUF4129 domain-containing protein [Thermoanaerobaculia bacterium]|nr:DUF4129 domain-containing protein [Thermoanaerobaculia bacterium]
MTRDERREEAEARPELPDVWQGPAPDDRTVRSPGLADVYEGPEPASADADGPAADAGAELAAIQDVVQRSQEPTDETDPGSGAPSRLVRVEADREAEDQLSHRGVAIVHHVVVPAAAIAMVGSLLFLLLDIRAVFVEGSFSLKWIGLCFVVATVLTARYGKSIGERDQAAFYTAVLAVVTFMAMAMSPWEPPQTEFWGPLLNGLVLYVTWRFATQLTRDLSADLDDTVRLRRRIFGMERVALETWRRQQEAEGRASYRNLGTTTPRADSESAQRSIVRLTFLGLGIFVVSELLLRRAHPDLAGQALAAIVSFLLSAGVLLGAASVAAQQRRLARLHASASWTLVTGRVVAALGLTVLVVALVLQIPATHLQGTGELEALPGETPTEAGGSVQKDTEQDRDDGAAAAGEGDGRSAEATTGSNPEGGGQPKSFDLVAALTRAGSWLRWPLTAIVLIVIAAAVVRWLRRQERPGRAVGRMLRKLSSRLAAACTRIWRMLDLLRGRAGRRPSDRDGHRPDLSRAIAALRDQDPGPAVIGAYAALQAALTDLGYARPAEATALEYTASIPGVLSRLRPAADRLTRLYLLAAYSSGRLAEAQRKQALDSLEELRLAIQLHGDELSLRG